MSHEPLPLTIWHTFKLPRLHGSGLDSNVLSLLPPLEVVLIAALPNEKVQRRPCARPRSRHYEFLAVSNDERFALAILCCKTLFLNLVFSSYRRAKFVTVFLVL